MMDDFDRQFNFMRKIFWVFFFAVAGMIFLIFAAYVIGIIAVACHIDFPSLFNGINHLIQKLSSI